ncbi:MAG: hypothetical protein FWF08_06225, partial [Oscillospiraceae bacterium]|nr:hypothetical protein [Oscillospiraceae bacterium]
DFLAVTDHCRYHPSLEAIEAYKDVKTEMTLMPGEEVHLGRGDDDHINDVHIVHFGGLYSINALVEGRGTEDRESYGKYRAAVSGCPETMPLQEYLDSVDALAETLEIPDDIERFTYASCAWITEKIREADGLSIFAHPYWISNVQHEPERLTDFLMEKFPFDAFEVLGGEPYFEQNGFQSIRYYEDRAKGRSYPIVGSSDSHNSVNNDKWNVGATIVFAPENERKALIAAIKEQYTVAVDNMSAEYRLVGGLRLVRYARFLMENYFPLHDELCFEEGRLMKAYSNGEEGAAEALGFIYGRVQRQREKYFKF